VLHAARLSEERPAHHGECDDKVSIPGVAAGGVVDVVASNVLSIPLGVYLASKINLNQVRRIRSRTRCWECCMPTRACICSLSIGALCTVLGGLCRSGDRQAREVLNGALASFLCVAFGIYAMTSGKIERSGGGAAGLIVISPILGRRAAGCG